MTRYWWMNTNPADWDIHREMDVGGIEPWSARDDNGRLKKYTKVVNVNDRALCYKTRPTSKLVAELKIVRKLGGVRGKESVGVQLVRFLEPEPPWFAISAPGIVAPKYLKQLRRQTFHPLTALEFECLLKLSGPAGADAVVTNDIAALDEEEHWEGGKKSRFISYYERDPGLRAGALRHHGTTCQVCGFDFEAEYGDHGAGYIEAHHMTPVSKLIKTTKVDPKKDMRVVCANCHRMLHRQRDHVLSINELRKLRNEAKSNRATRRAT
jgi:hypothetical protein